MKNEQDRDDQRSKDQQHKVAVNVLAECMGVITQ